MSLFLAGLSALLYGIADFFGGFSADRNSTLSVVIVSQFAGVLVALAAIFFIPAAPLASDFLWGLLAGVSGALGLLTLYRGIAKSIVSIVSPVSALLSALLPMLFGLLIGERPSGIGLGGAALCLPAIVLLSMGSARPTDGTASAPGRPVSSAGRTVRSALAQGCLAGLGFGVFFIALSRTSPASGLWPVVFSRGSSLLFVLALAGIRREPVRIAKGSLVCTVCGGAADMGANIAFLLASRTGLLTLASIISSLYPVPTVLLGCIVFKEKIPLPRLIGLVLAVAGVALISLR